jgi:hypothetical protein
MLIGRSTSSLQNISLKKIYLCKVRLRLAALQIVLSIKCSLKLPILYLLTRGFLKTHSLHLNVFKWYVFLVQNNVEKAGVAAAFKNNLTVPLHEVSHPGGC